MHQGQSPRESAAQEKLGSLLSNACLVEPKSLLTACALVAKVKNILCFRFTHH